MNNEEAIKILDQMPIPSHFFRDIKDIEPVTFEEMAEAIEMAIEALKNERPQGKWIKYGMVYRCSCCNYFPVGNIADEKFEDLSRLDAFYFCPHCGADMSLRGDDDV